MVLPSIRPILMENFLINSSNSPIKSVYSKMNDPIVDFDGLIQFKQN